MVSLLAKRPIFAVIALARCARARVGYLRSRATGSRLYRVMRICWCFFVGVRTKFYVQFTFSWGGFLFFYQIWLFSMVVEIRTRYSFTNATFAEKCFYCVVAAIQGTHPLFSFLFSKNSVRSDCYLCVSLMPREIYCWLLLGTWPHASSVVIPGWVPHSLVFVLATLNMSSRTKPRVQGMVKVTDRFL